ncbi:hypothetical protein [Phyllobacterium bourgognense]|jgi:hypothetical protein|uniref:hypothetical protein n=1 Tax=Phyllobacterium bourgognense TaxID=314236 RepID=UPI0015EFE160|nr:hypothetical protein [Phyllobacterium bourgognense]
MSDDEKPKRNNVVHWQLRRPEYGDALRSRHLPLPNDATFVELLRRLDEAETNQTKK